MSVKILKGDCRDVLRTLPDESVHCVVTSPPYWGLRDYGTARWEGGDAGCDHQPPREHGNSVKQTNGQQQHAGRYSGRCCWKCGARRIDSQIGLESSFTEYIETMRAVFAEVWRVLRKDGTLWLNCGDSYASQGGYRDYGSHDNYVGRGPTGGQRPLPVNGLKPKDLCGIPWRLALALQADGWVLRQEIIWAKSNPMPESVVDRCTKAHEQLFMFAKARWSGPQPTRFSNISDQDARWLAALIDAEGCIVIKRCQHEGRSDTFAPQVSFGSTSRALIDEFARLAGHGNTLERPGKNSPMFYWQLANGVARDFLHRIYPWLIVKKRQARIGIFVDSLTYYRGGKKPERKQRSESEHEQLVSLWARNKECNRFGNPDLSDVPEPVYGKWADCERYYYDATAIAKPQTDVSLARRDRADLREKEGWADAFHGNPPKGVKRPRLVDRDREAHERFNARWLDSSHTTRNRRTVWEIATAPFSEAHFATFPPALVEPCIKAGTSEWGCCAKCGAPWVRQTERTAMVINRSERTHEKGRTRSSDTMVEPPTTITLGWAPSCQCDAATVSATVLDPFFGAGTTGLVCDRLGRNCIGIELNPEYADMAERRIKQDAGMFAEVIA